MKRLDFTAGNVQCGSIFEVMSKNQISETSQRSDLRGRARFPEHQGVLLLQSCEAFEVHVILAVESVLL